MSDRDESDDQPRPPKFRFRLVSLFILIALAAFILGLARCGDEEAAVLLILEAGVLCTLLLAGLGLAVGREWGGLVGTGVGAVLWALLVAVAYVKITPWWDPPLPPATLGLQCIAWVAAVVTIAGFCIATMRSTEPPEEDSHTTGRLVASQRKRQHRE